MPRRFSEHQSSRRFVLFSPLLYASGCGPSTRPLLRVGFIPFSNCLPFFLAIEKGYFSASVSPVRFNDSSDAMNALLGGHIDALSGVTLASYWAVEQQQSGKLRLFLPHYEVPSDPFSYLIVPRNSNVKEVRQLMGKKIGTYTGVSQLLYLKLFLNRCGLVPGKDVDIVQVGSGLQLQALASGQFDALFTVEPYGTTAVLKGIGTVLLASPRTSHIQNPFWAGAAGVTAATLIRIPDAVRALSKGMARAVSDIRNDALLAKSILPKYTPIDPEVARQSGLYKWVLPEEHVSFSGMQELADMMTNAGVLRAPIDAVGMLIPDAKL